MSTGTAPGPPSLDGPKVVFSVSAQGGTTGHPGKSGWSTLRPPDDCEFWEVWVRVV